MGITYEYSKVMTTAVLGLLVLGSLLCGMRPKLIVLLYVAVLLLFTGTLYGTNLTLTANVAASSISTIYSRGAGQLPVSILNIYLVALCAFSLCVTKPIFGKRVNSSDPVLLSLLFLAVAYCLYAIYGIRGNITLENALSPFGMINFANMLFLYLVLKWSITEEEDLRRFEKVFVGLCGFMALYGLVRLPFGGNPANYYCNFEGKSSRLSFFDFGQSALFCITLVILYMRRGGLSTVRARGWAFSLLCLANIVLSYRRTAWVGLLLVFIWFLFTSDIKRKVTLSIIGCLVFLSVLATMQSRFAGTGTKGRFSFAQDITDSKGNLAVRDGRFGQLYYAVLVASESPLFGLGPWGENREFRSDIAIHSSVIDTYLKMGLMGLIPYALILFGFPVWWIRKRREQWHEPHMKNLAEAFFCGFVFWLPDILFGTPIMVFRHCQVLAIIMAVPVVAYAIDMRARRKETGRELA